MDIIDLCLEINKTQIITISPAEQMTSSTGNSIKYDLCTNWLREGSLTRVSPWYMYSTVTTIQTVYVASNQSVLLFWSAVVQ